MDYLDLVDALLGDLTMDNYCIDCKAVMTRDDAGLK